MQNEENNLADPIRASEPNHEDSSSGAVQLSANTILRLEKLAPWRIDPTSVKFPNCALKFEGGYAEVSRAFLGSSTDDSGDQIMESNVGSLMSSNGTSTAAGNNKPQEVEGSEEGKRTEEQESDNEIPWWWKAVAVKKMKVKTPDEIVRVLGLALRESEFLAKLSHENIITFEGLVEDVSKGMIWLVFPWEENGTLKDFIASADWEIPERISLIRDVAKGVEYLHQRKPPICHGDLKSINILVNSDCIAVITDFGSARHPMPQDLEKKGERVKIEPQPAPSPEATFHPLSNTITLTCNQYTLRWAAPELLAEDDASLASDIWALGCVAYEVMTNSIPFQDVKDAVVIERVVRGDLPSLSSEARMLLIQRLCTLVGQCWNTDPSKRPTAVECRKAINWMPMIIPTPARTANAAGLAERSAGLLIELGKMHRRQSDYSNASKYFAEALAVYVKIANRRGEANALFELGQIFWLQDEYDQAITSYSDALEIYRELSDRLGRADVLVGLADVHRLRGEYSQATTLYSECVEICTAIGNRQVRADALWGLAELHRVQDEYSEAVTFFSESLQIQIDIGDMQGQSDSLSGLAEVHRYREEYNQAITCFSKCLQIQTDLGDKQGRANALSGLADVHRAQKEYSQAMSLYSDALIVFIDTGDRYRRAFTLRRIGDVHRDQNDPSTAIDYYEQAAEIFKQIGNKTDEANALKHAANARRSMEQQGAMTFG